MARLILTVGAVFLAFAIWRIGGQMSADAVGLAVGVVFGVLAGLPAAVLVLAGERRRQADDQRRSERGPTYGYGGQPPVIVLTSGVQQADAGQLEQRATPVRSRRPARQFNWVGIQEDRSDR